MVHKDGENTGLLSDQICIGGLIVMLLIDAVIYLCTHIDNIRQSIGDQRPEYFFAKHSLISLTAIILTIAIPRIAYINIIKRFPETKGLLTLFCYILAFIIPISFMTMIYSPARIGFFAPVITVYFVCMGWWIQSMTTARNSKRSHTLNTILSTRTNEVYQRNLKGYTTLVPDGCFIKSELCSMHVNRDKFDDKEYQSSLAFKYKDAIESCIYMLNYFEFIAEGICSNDLDEKLIKDCFGSFFKNLDSRLCYLIVEVRKRQPTGFSFFIEIVEKWYTTSLTRDPESTESIKALGKAMPSDDMVERDKQEELAV